MLALIRHYEQFQSTLSMRRANSNEYYQISIHLFQSTLSMRRATGQEQARIVRRDFNPRSP